METQNKDLQVEVLEIDKANNTVLVSTQEGQDWYEIHPPASINFAKQGQATIRFNGAGGICYIRSAFSPKKTFGSPSGSSGYGGSGFKGYTQKNTFGSGGFTPAKTYTPKTTSKWGEGVKWDEISWGKCKHAYLLELFKQGKELGESEIEAEKWANASMRKLSEQEIINKEITTQSPKVTSQVTPQQVKPKTKFNEDEMRAAGYSDEEIQEMLSFNENKQ